VAEAEVSGDLDPDLRRLLRAAMFFAVCVAAVVIAALTGVFH
jgi:hypothetical protein